MNLNVTRFIPAAVTQKSAGLALVAKQHSPKAMFVVGCVGVVGTAVLAARATLKLESHLQSVDDLKTKSLELHLARPEEYTEKDMKSDQVKIIARGAFEIAKLYAPTVICGVATIGLLTGSHVTLQRRNAGLGAALLATQEAYDKYRARVREEFGEEKDLELRHGVVETKEVVAGKDGKAKTVKHKRAGEPSMYAVEWNEFTARNWQPYPHDNWFYIQCQQRTANDKLRANGHIFLNEVYDLLGVERSSAGAVVGWVLDSNGDGYVDFGIENGTDNFRDFMVGRKNGILIDPNVDGPIYELIDKMRSDK